MVLIRNRLVKGNIRQTVFITQIAVTRMGVWTMQMEGILRYYGYSDKDLVGFFGYQHRMKISTARKRLLSADFSERWVNILSLVRVKGVTLDFLLSVIST